MEASEKYEKALSLKKGQYAELIQDLFETPKENLEKSIRAQSKATNYVTAAVAILSILIGIYVTVQSGNQVTKNIEAVVSNMDSTVSSLQALEEQSEMIVNALDSSVTALTSIEQQSSSILGSLETIEGYTEDVVKKYWEDHPVLRRVLDEIKKDRERLSGKNQIALSYIFKISKLPGDLTYKDYLTAYRFAGVEENILQEDSSIFGAWDQEWLALCERALAQASGKTGRASQAERFF